MIDESTYNELDRYFRSAMNAEEKSAFELHLQSSKELQEELQWLNIMLGGMKQQGRSVMKQTIAHAVAGVPAAHVAKYVPSLNGKSFLQKWWWSIGSVVIVAAAIAFYYATRHPEPAHSEGDYFQEGAPVSDSAPMDTPGNSNNLDSSSPGAQPVGGNAEIKYGNDTSKYYEEVTRVDTIRGNQVAQQQIPQHGSRVEGMKTSINPRSQPPYTYTLGQNLVLNANYSTTSGFQFQGSGDTIYMTDNKGQMFRLVPTSKEKPLVPIGVSK